MQLGESLRPGVEEKMPPHTPLDAATGSVLISIDRIDAHDLQNKSAYKRKRRKNACVVITCMNLALFDS